MRLQMAMLMQTLTAVERSEFVIIKSPSDKIVPAAGGRAVICKLEFDKNDIEYARKTLGIPASNVA